MISMAGKAIRKWWALFALPTFAAFIIGFVIPFIMGVYLSFCKFATVTDAEFVGLKNYKRAFVDKEFLHALGFSDGEFTDRKSARAEADWLCSDYLNENDRVFFVSQGDNGEHWFSAVFDFYPVLVDYSGVGATQEGGGGTFGLPELEPQEEGVKQRYYHPYTAERLDETVRANGCTVLYLQKIDDIFVQSYQNLFTDHLAAAQAGQTLLYRVTDAGYEPVTMQMSKEAA